MVDGDGGKPARQKTRRKTGHRSSTNGGDPESIRIRLTAPLGGIWLRVPYLHNGFVPALRDSLNPPNERPETLHRGYDVFDPVKVGFREAAAAGDRADGRIDATL